MKRYEAKQFARLKGLSGISDGLLQDHFKLYEGYVKNVNEITAQLEALAKEGKAKWTGAITGGNIAGDIVWTKKDGTEMRYSYKGEKKM